MSRIHDLRQALKLEEQYYTNSDVVGLAKMVSTAKLEPRDLLVRSASTQKLDEASRLAVDGFSELAAVPTHAKVAAIMAEGYQHGDQELGLPCDTILAETLQRQAMAEKDLVVVPDAIPEEPEAISEEPAPIQSAKRQQYTKRMHELFLWHTRLRLFALRALRLVSFSSGIVFPTWVTQGLAYLGLSYFPEGLIDLGTLARIYFFPTPAELASTKDGRARVGNAYHKGSRSTRVWNFRWALGNLADLIIAQILIAAGVMLPIITAVKAINDLVWFVSDVVEEGFKCFFEVRKYNRRLKIIENKINRVKDELKAPENKDDVAKLKELAIWEHYRTLALEKKKVEVAKCWRAIRVAMIIVIGMAMILLPQFLPVLMVVPPDVLQVITDQAFKITGAAIALFGSVYGGLGLAVCNMIRLAWNKHFPEPQPDLTKLQQESNSPLASDSENTYHNLLKKTGPVNLGTIKAAALQKLSFLRSPLSEQANVARRSQSSPAVSSLPSPAMLPLSPDKVGRAISAPVRETAALSEDTRDSSLSITIPSSAESSPVKSLVSPTSISRSPSALFGCAFPTVPPTPAATPAPTPRGARRALVFT